MNPWSYYKSKKSNYFIVVPLIRINFIILFSEKGLCLSLVVGILVMNLYLFANFTCYLHNYYLLQAKKVNFIKFTNIKEVQLIFE